MGSSMAITGAVALLVLAIAAFALGLANPRADKRAAALHWLRAIRWQELARLVAGMLSLRGLQRDDLNRRPGEDGFDLRVSRGSARYLVQCKHGGAFQVDADAVRELQRMIQLLGADGGILVTTGTITPQANAYAAEQAGMELIDGLRLWPQVEPLIDAEVRDAVAADVRARRRRKWVLAGALGVVGGLAAALVMALSSPEAGTAPGTGTGRPVAPAPARQPDVPETAPETAPEAAPDASGLLPLPDPTLSEEQLQGRRAEAQRVVRTIPEIGDARWSTRSTLLLELRGTPDDPTLETIVESVCAELLRFEELRYTRLQLQRASTGDDEPVRVRWRQCR